INMDGVQNSRIENNLIYDAHASGISLYRIDGGGPSSGNVVVNNTIHQASNGRWALNIRDGAVNNTLLNNVLVTQHSFRGAIDISADSLSGLTSDYNAVVSRFTTNSAGSILNLSQWQAQTGQDAHSFVATPAALFEDWAAGDYRLKAGSPAINKGTSMLAPGVDLFGHPRPAGAVDIGAIESGSALTADFNDDGSVDASDLAAWSGAFGTAPVADSDGDNDSDGADFLQWQRQLGGGAPVTAIPEPATLSLANLSWLLGLAATGRRVRCV
ncbi:MAG: right-handed parallel beta-helix repeat-containing protein, partial [Pirellulales bacterium]|nr:right-handed parallel beta-helix repeat-containing protein [Pirellulales bacterium]